MDAMLADVTDVPEFDPGRDALFLDFDGTLVEIAPRPDAVVVPEALPQLLSRAHGALGGALAVVSGRTLGELERYLAGFPGEIVGSHGAERRGAEALAVEGVDRLHDRLLALADRHDLLAEFKTLGGALHYRDAPHRADEVRALVEALAQEIPGFAVQPAKMAFEVKPRGVSKDAALEALAAGRPFAGRRPFYLGDDTTDEPALAWAQDRGGIGIKVGEGDSVARHRLQGPEAVHAWLSRPLGGR